MSTKNTLEVALSILRQRIFSALYESQVGDFDTDLFSDELDQLFELIRSIKGGEDE